MWHLERSRMPLRLGITPGAGLVTPFKLRLDSVSMEESVVILIFVDVLVEETT